MGRDQGVGMIEAIAKLIKCENLTEEEAASAFSVIMRGDATPSQIAGFVVALRIKGETVDEITGFARTARAVATPIHVEGALLDTCGTGGAALATLNKTTPGARAAPARGRLGGQVRDPRPSPLCGSGGAL